MYSNKKKLMVYRWIIWGVLISAYVISQFHRSAIGVLREELTMEFGLSSTMFAYLAATYSYAYMIMQIPTGMLADSLGAKKTVTIGTIIAGIGSIIMGFATNIFLLFLGRLSVGLGVSVVFVCILKTQSEWFRESEFGTMAGLTLFAGGLGGMLAQTPLTIMVSMFSWRVSFAAIGIMGLLIALLCHVFVINKPSDMGLPSFEEIEGNITSDSNVEKTNLMQGLAIVLRNPNTWAVILVFAGFTGALSSFTAVWGRSYLVDVYGISKIEASNYIMITVLGLALGSIIIGKLSDTIKKRKLPMIIFGTTYVICWGIIVFVNGGKPPIEILLPLLFILGFSCSVFVLGIASSKELNPPKTAGISTSCVNIGGFIGPSILPPMLGKIFDMYGSTLPAITVYQMAFKYCFASTLIGFVFILFIKETNCRNVYKRKDSVIKNIRAVNE